MKYISKNERGEHYARRVRSQKRKYLWHFGCGEPSERKPRRRVQSIISIRFLPRTVVHFRHDIGKIAFDGRLHFHLGHSVVIGLGRLCRARRVASGRRRATAATATAGRAVLALLFAQMRKHAPSNDTADKKYYQDYKDYFERRHFTSSPSCRSTSAVAATSAAATVANALLFLLFTTSL